MWKTKEVFALVIAGSLLLWAVGGYTQPVKTKTVVVTAPKPTAKEVKKPVAKEVKKPAGKEVTTPDPKKDPNRKKPTLKAKYANKK